MKSIRRIMLSFNKKGASAVEFAVVFPLLLLIMFAIIEYGWVMSCWIVLTNSTSQGARAAILGQDADVAVRESLWGVMLDNSPTNELIINVEELASGSPEAGYPKRCKVSTSWSVERLIGFLPSSMVPETLTSESVMAYIK